MLSFRSAFSSLTFLLLLVSMAIFAVPSMAEESIPFSRSGRVVDRRVPRSLKHYRPHRPIAARLDSRTYGDSGNGYGSDNDSHGYGGDHGGYGGNDNNGHGGYGGGNDGGDHGGYGGNDNNGHGGYGGGNNGGYGGDHNGGGNGGYGGGDNGGYGGGHNGGYGGGGHQPPVYGHPSQSPPKPTPTPYNPGGGYGGSHGY